MSELALGDVVAEIASASCGVDFVYRLLDRLTVQTLWSDAVLVVDDSRLGRQLFRAGRRSPLSSDLSRQVAGSPPGIYVEGGQADEGLSAAVVQLAEVALRFDVARQQAARDGLTGLFNRRAFDDLLAQAAARTQRAGWPFALVLLDVDGFKAVNDKLGHAGGDAVLQTIGTEMRRMVRAGDVAARIGGDEFALILHGGGQDEVAVAVKRVADAVARCTEGLEVELSAGIAAAPGESTDPLELYRIADRRLYEAKRR